jgi:hypothetical protein
MEKFFCGEGSTKPEGYKPPAVHLIGVSAQINDLRLIAA